MPSIALRQLRSSKTIQRILGLVALVFLLSSLTGSLRGSRNDQLEETGQHAHIDSPVLSNDINDSSGFREPSKAFVVASMKKDDTSWLIDYFPDWQANIYVMDDPSANLTVSKNKGRESAAYLTYLIDNYYRLPDIMLFLHALRYQWHNEDPMYDGVPVVRNLQLSHVVEVGYANLRCTWTIGCPAEIQPEPEVEDDGADDRAQTERAYTLGFRELFPGKEIPDMVGIQCGAQFALSKEQVRKRPREDYVRYRKWLWETDLPDNVSGRILEYSWHMIMGKPAVHCPPAQDCFCEKFGLCNLTCKDESSCEKRYWLPQYATIPDGWPKKGPGKDGFPPEGWYL